jgi:hypothetical protein
MRFSSKAVAGFLLAGVGAVVVAACGSSSSSSGGSAGGGSKTIDIYSSLPLKGAVSAQTLPTVEGELHLA